VLDYSSTRDYNDRILAREGVTLYSGPEDEKPVTGQDLTIWCKWPWQQDSLPRSRSGWKVATLQLPPLGRSY